MGPVVAGFRHPRGITSKAGIAHNAEMPAAALQSAAMWVASIYVQLADNGASYATGQIYGAAGGGGQP